MTSSTATGVLAGEIGGTLILFLKKRSPTPRFLRQNRLLLRLAVSLQRAAQLHRGLQIAGAPGKVGRGVIGAEDASAVRGRGAPEDFPAADGE